MFVLNLINVKSRRTSRSLLLKIILVVFHLQKVTTYWTDYCQVYIPSYISRVRTFYLGSRRIRNPCCKQSDSEVAYKLCNESIILSATTRIVGALITSRARRRRVASSHCSQWRSPGGCASVSSYHDMPVTLGLHARAPTARGAEPLSSPGPRSYPFGVMLAQLTRALHT